MKVYGDSVFVIIQADDGYIFVEEESGAGIYTLYLGLYEKPKTYNLVRVEDHFGPVAEEQTVLEDESVDTTNEEEVK